jgi:uncharacterized membrane protein
VHRCLDLVRGEAGAAIGLGLTVVGFAFAIYLLYLQAFVIEAFCHWCPASDGVMTVLLVLGVLRLAAALRPVEGVGDTQAKPA